MTGINFLGAELAAKRLGLLSWCPGLLALPYSSIRTRHGVPSRYCETWKLLLALTPSSRHELSRLAPWPRETGLAGWACETRSAPGDRQGVGGASPLR